MPHIEDTYQSYRMVNNFLLSLVLSQARIFFVFTLVPFMSGSSFPMQLRTSISLGYGLIIAPLVYKVLPDMTSIHLMGLLVKESFIGICMSFLMSVPFWYFESLGFLVDNQRGANIGSLVDAITGNETSAFGQFTYQVFIGAFFWGNGLLILLHTIYSSFIFWNIFDWYPSLGMSCITYFITSYSNILKFALLYSSPILVGMFMSELGLALISRFATQLQVFILAIPVKTAVGFFIAVASIGCIIDLMIKHTTGIFMLVNNLRSLGW